MAEISQIFGAVLIVMGSFFFVVGAVGIFRMPDVFTRMHAAGISDTAGAGLLLVGMMFVAGLSLVTVKLAVILVVILYSSPIATHAVAQAALHAGLEPILANKKIMVGPGAHPVPEKDKAKKAPPQTKSRTPTRRPAGKTSGKARSTAARKGRTRS